MHSCRPQPHARRGLEHGSLETVLGRLHQDLIRAGWPVTASIGSITAIEATSPESLLRQADQVLYEVKKTGKAAVRAAEAGDSNPVA